MGRRALIEARHEVTRPFAIRLYLANEKRIPNGGVSETYPRLNEECFAQDEHAASAALSSIAHIS